MSSENTRPDLTSVMRRLRKIMALSKSSNPGEASAALHQAQVLMAKHNLTAQAVEQSEITESTVKTSGSDLPEWESHLAVVVSNALGVEILVESQRKQRGLRRKNASIVFVGKGCSTQIAAYSYSVLKKQMLADLQTLMNKAGANLGVKVTILKTSPAQRNAYALGWCQAAYNKVRAIKPGMDPCVTEYVKQRSSGEQAKIRDSKKMSDERKAAFASLGYEHGKNARLNAAMNNGLQVPLLVQ